MRFCKSALKQGAKNRTIKLPNTKQNRQGKKHNAQKDKQKNPPSSGGHPPFESAYPMQIYQKVAEWNPVSPQKRHILCVYVCFECVINVCLPIFVYFCVFWCVFCVLFALLSKKHEGATPRD